MAASTAATVSLLTNMPVILRPAPQKRVEQANQISSLRLSVCLHDRPDLVQERFHALLGWLNEQFAIVLADVLAQKVEALRYVRDHGFLN